jgi:hypothetical protein
MRFHAVQPTLTTLSFSGPGTTIDLPLAQYHGSGHRLTTYLRVTPQGQEPVYLIKTDVLPEVPTTYVEGEVAGTFATAEGASMWKRRWRTTFGRPS